MVRWFATLFARTEDSRDGSWSRLIAGFRYAAPLFEVANCRGSWRPLGANIAAMLVEGMEPWIGLSASTNMCSVPAE